ncbi:MAG: hypothetical protein JW838_10150 [Spirochaetes bacterium]|nr:hypothetical protein [Spirochaetota bacterium]
MKVTTRVAVAAMACTLVLASPARGATDPETGEGAGAAYQPKVSLGFSLFYTWWRPMIPTTTRQGNALAVALQNQGSPYWPLAYGIKEVRPYYSSAPVFGPSLLVRVAPRWTLSMNALYGKYEFENIDVKTIHKLELDLIASFAVVDWFRVYGGAKYFGRINPAAKSHKGGLGLGIAFNVNLYRGLYLLPNISGLTLGDREFLTAGVNGALSLAYYFEKIRLTVALGGRCQYMKDVYVFNRDSQQTKNKKLDDLYYGPYLSLVYTF